MNGTTIRMGIYALFSVAGLVGTWTYNLAYMREHGGGFDIAQFFAGGFVNSAAASLTMDLLVGSTAALIFLVIEARRLKMRHAWVYVAVFYLVAFAAAFPLFLLMRERALAASRSAQ